MIELRSKPVPVPKGRHPTDTTTVERNRTITSEQREIDDLLAAAGQEAVIVRRHFRRLFNGIAATVTPPLRRQLERHPLVRRVWDDVLCEGTVGETVSLVGAPTVWAGLGATGKGVTVAIIDSGIDYTHPDLGGCFGAGCKVARGYDFVDDDEDPFDLNGHGTHVAGIVAASAAGPDGVAGIAPDASLLAYRVLDTGNVGRGSDIIAAIEGAVEAGADVANLSLGTPGGSPDDPMSQAVDAAVASGLVCVVAAGNEHCRHLAWMDVASPGMARRAIAVGSTHSEVLATYSSRGPVDAPEGLLLKPDLSAPGFARSTVPAAGSNGDPSGYRSLDGTSMAAPHVAGAAALLRQLRPGLSPEQIKALLVERTQALQYPSFAVGSGRLDLVAATASSVIAMPTAVNLGVIDPSGGRVTREAVVTLTNKDTVPRQITVSTDMTGTHGVSISADPRAITLAAGGTGTVMIGAEIDPTVASWPEDTTPWHAVTLLFRDDGSTARVPAYFVFQSATTLVSAGMWGPGTGRVTSSVGGLNCDSNGAACTIRVATGSQITLHAEPDSGSTFSGWKISGAADRCSASACTLTARFPIFAEAAFEGGSRHITETVPKTLTAGGTRSLAVYGDGGALCADCSVVVNGAPRPTTFVGGNAQSGWWSFNVELSPEDLSGPGLLEIAVRSPAGAVTPAWGVPVLPAVPPRRIVDASCTDVNTDGLCDDGQTYRTIARALADAQYGDTIAPTAGQYAEGQLTIAKYVRLEGAGVTIVPRSDLACAAPGDAWIRVVDGGFLSASVTFDGEGRNIPVALRLEAPGARVLLQSAAIRNIGASCSGAPVGTGVESLGADLEVWSTTLQNIQQVGLDSRDGTLRLFSTTLVGRLPSSWPQYGVRSAGPHAALWVTQSVFDRFSGGSESDPSAAVLLGTGSTGAIERNTFTANSVGVRRSGVRVAYALDGGETYLRQNRFGGNVRAAVDFAVADSASRIDGNPSANWWGCNAGPGAPGCDALLGADASLFARLQLRLSAAPGTNGTVTVTANLQCDNWGFCTSSVGDGTPIRFAASRGSITTEATTLAGVATATLTGISASDDVTVTASLDGEMVSLSLPHASATISRLTPSHAPANSEAFTLIVNGSGFVDGASVLWNGAARQTTYVGPTEVRAAVLPVDLAAAAAVNISVVNPLPGGAGGNAATFTVDPSIKPEPVVTWVPPENIVYGTPLGPGQLNATANVPGTFVYTPPTGTVLSPGTGQELTLRFWPTDNKTYAVVTRVVTIDVLYPPALYLSTVAMPRYPAGLFDDGTGHAYVTDWTTVRRVALTTGASTIVAGSGTVGYDGDGIPATSAQLNGPTGVVADTAGNVYVADTWNHRVRKIAVDSMVITTIAGTGVPGFSGDGGPATAAALNEPTFLAIDTVGNVLISDSRNNRVRKVTLATGMITTIAGSGGSEWWLDGVPATSAVLSYPQGLVVDHAGNIFIADTWLHAVKKVDGATGIITKVAGSHGACGFAGDAGPAAAASLCGPAGLALSAAGDLYIADAYNWRIRKIGTQTGLIWTVAGTGAAGSDGDDGPALFAQLKSPGGLTVDASGILFIADLGNGVRRLGPNLPKTLPVIDWENPARIIAGTALGGTQLNATANLPGTFLYSPSTGTVLPVGLHQPITVTFAPTNTAYYGVQTKTVHIDVLPSPPTFADQSLRPGQTPVRGVHVIEMRQAIDSMRALHGLAPFTWTDSSIVPGVTPVRAAHMTELCHAVAEVYDAAGLARPILGASAITTGTSISATHVAELRAAILALW